MPLLLKSSKRLLKASPKLTVTSEVKELKLAIAKANVDYHSKGKPTLSDKAYDALKDRLTVLRPNDPVLKQVGAPLTRGKAVKLPVTMDSLDKLYVDDLKKFKNWLKANVSNIYIISAKIDGVSALLLKRMGKLYMYTRGDGTEGQNISHLIPHIRHVPSLNEGQMVRGELAISKADFKKYLAKKFKNPRNLVAGVVNKTKQIHEAAKYTQFIVHELIKPHAVPLYRCGRDLEKMGAKLVTHMTVKSNVNLTRLSEALTNIKRDCEFETDGIVLDDGNGNRIAIKEENEVATPICKEIVWGVSRHGYLTPVAHFVEPVKIAGVEVSKATAHNARMIFDKKIGPGAIIEITRAGEVIPKIIGVILPAPKPQMPLKGTWEWVPPAEGNTQSVFIRSTAKEDDATIGVLGLVNFLETLGVKGFKENLLKLLFDAGVNTPLKLMKVSTRTCFKAGLGKKQSETLVETIVDALSNATVPQMMVASNCFPRGFGIKSAKAVWSVLDTRLLDPDSKPKHLKFALLNISGFGEVATASLLAGLPAFKSFLFKSGWQIPTTVKRAVGTKLEGVSVVFTGFRDQALQDKLESQGAVIRSSLSSKTTYLIVNHKSYKNDKTAKALDLGVPIIDITQAHKL